MVSYRNVFQPKFSGFIIVIIIIIRCHHVLKFIVFFLPQTNIFLYFIIKPTGCTNFTNLFCRETLHVSDSSCVHHQEFIHFTLSNGIMSYRFVDSFRAESGWKRHFLCPSSGVYSLYTQQRCMSYRFVDSFRAELGWNCSKAVYKTCMTYTVAECIVDKLLMMDVGTVRNM